LKSIGHVINICDVAGVEWHIEVSLDYVEDAHVVTSVHKLLDNMPAKKSAATNDHIKFLHFLDDNCTGYGKRQEWDDIP